jgi:DNA-binding CsgD family transcriptional regulator
MLQTLDPGEVRWLKAASRKLERLAPSAGAAGIFDAIRPCMHWAAGLFSIIRPSAPGSLVIHAVNLPTPAFEGWLGTPTEQSARALAPVIRSDAGRLWRDSETLAREQREKLDVLRVLEAENLGEGAGYKILERATPEHGVEHFMLAMIMERGHAIPRRSDVMLAALNPALRATVLRLSLPFVGRVPFQAQILEERRQGYICFSLQGSLLEANRRAHDLVARYQVAARIQGRRNAVAAFGERARELTPGDTSWVLPASEPGSWLQVTTHRMSREAYDLMEDALLVVMEELIVPQPSAEAPFTPAEWKVVRLLVGTGGSHKEIADELGISKRTVDTHMDRIHKKAGVHSSGELRVWLRRRGIT